MKGKRITEKAEHLLLRAESEFVADSQRRSLEYWYNAVMVDVAPIDEVRRYALDNRWAERRRSYWRGVQAAWLKQQHVQLIQQRKAELHQVVDLRSQVYDLIRPVADDMGVEQFPIQVKSWEGAARVFIGLDDLAETKRDSILGQLEPMLAAAEKMQEEGPADLPFTRDEMRLVAHSLLKQRRKQRRLEMGIEDDDEEESDSGDVESGSGGSVARSKPGGGGVASKV